MIWSLLRKIAWAAFLVGMLISSTWLFGIGEHRSALHTGGFMLAMVGAVASLGLAILQRAAGGRVANG